MKRRSLFKSLLGIILFPSVVRSESNYLSCKEIDDAFNNSENKVSEEIIKKKALTTNAYYGKVKYINPLPEFGTTIRKNSFK